MPDSVLRPAESDDTAEGASDGGMAGDGQEGYAAYNRPF